MVTECVITDVDPGNNLVIHIDVFQQITVLKLK